MHRRFNLAFMAFCLGGAAALLVLAAWLEPVRGDLTRLGFYSENDFGWHGAQAVFVPARAQAGRLEGRYDVVVLGDSFSGPAPGEAADGRYWADHLAAATGLAVGVFHLRQAGIDAVLASPAGRGARLVVLEVVERMLAAELDRPGPCGEPPAPPAAPLPMGAAVAAERRREMGLEVSPGRMAYLFAFIRTNAQRWVTGRDGTKVRNLALRAAGPFTSRRADRLLVYAQDFDRRGWDAGTWARIGCRAKTIQTEVAGHGAGFLLLVAPDKTTAYAALLGEEDRAVEALPKLPQGLALVRADEALRAAIAAGVRDIYLPNDTHWGSAGAAIVAREVIAAAGAGRFARGSPHEVASAAR